MPQRKNFPVYLECEVGGKSKHQLIQEIEASDMEVDDWCKSMMSLPGWKPGRKELVRFAKASIADLGLTGYEVRTQDVLTRISDLGHSLCKPGDGPAIRFALTSQRPQILHVAMRPIFDRDIPHIFLLASFPGRSKSIRGVMVPVSRRWYDVRKFKFIFRLGN